MCPFSPKAIERPRLRALGSRRARTCGGNEVSEEQEEFIIGKFVAIEELMHDIFSFRRATEERILTLGKEENA